MNSCITGFIQYKHTNNITSKLKKSKAPPNKKVWSFEELFNLLFIRFEWNLIVTPNIKNNYTRIKYTHYN